MESKFQKQKLSQKLIAKQLVHLVFTNKRYRDQIIRSSLYNRKKTKSRIMNTHVFSVNTTQYSSNDDHNKISGKKLFDKIFEIK